MSPQEPGIPSPKKLYNTTLKSLKSYPFLFVPFLIFAIFEFLTLVLIYLAPRMPLRLIFGPPIRTFWGEGFLHYPANFILMPKLASLARMGLSIFLGSLLTAMAVLMVSDVYHKKEIKLKQSFKSALKKYISLFWIVFILTVSLYILVKIITMALAKYFLAGHSRLLFLNSKIWMGPLLLCLNFILAILIQSAFIYAVPILIIGKEKLIKSITDSFLLFKKLFIPTILLVGLPMLLFIPVLILQDNTSFLITKLFPEFIFLVSLLSIILTSLIIDPVITVSTTILYLRYKEK